MITKAQAIMLGARFGSTTLHHVSLENADGTPMRCRVNGKCKTWKTRPKEFRLPVKYGFRDCFYITHLDADKWYIPVDILKGLKHESK